MAFDELAKRLHDKASRGEALSDKEKEILETWYRKLDQEEFDILNLRDEFGDIQKLQRRIEESLIKLTNLARQIQETEEENLALKAEVASLRRQLAQPTTSRPI